MNKNLHFVQRSFVVFVLLLFCTISTHAQDWNQIIKATAGDRNALTDIRSGSYEYGRAVAIFGNYAMIGSQEENGIIYVLRNDSGKWVQIKTLVCPDLDGWGAEGDFIRSGGPIALSGDYAVIGAPLSNEDSTEANDLTNAGAAYILKKDQGGTDNWGIVKKITASRPMIGDMFGYTVAISGDYVVVGAPQEDDDAAGGNTIDNAGSAFIFKKDQGGTDNWGEVRKITAETRQIDAVFGTSVSISGDYVMVGAPLVYASSVDPARTNGPGSACIFKKDQGGSDQWGLVKTIVPSDGSNRDYFGFTVSISGDYAVAGAWLEDQNAQGGGTVESAGSAYIFKKDRNGSDNWGQLKKIVASDRAYNDQFGYAVATDGNYIAVGARYESNSNGAVYIFSKNSGGADNWGQIKKTNSSDRSPEELLLGISLAISNGYILAGGPRSSTDLSESNDTEAAGAAFFFQKDSLGTDNWGEVQKVVKMQVVAQDQFGYSVAISGDYAIVGTPYEDNDAAGLKYFGSSGAAYIFYNNAGNWQQVKKITAVPRRENASFGISVSMDGDYAVVGASTDINDLSGAGTGAAYIFGKAQGGPGSWGLVKKITAASSFSGDLFGSTVAISGGNLVIGAPGHDYSLLGTNPVTNSGAVYIFTKDKGGENNWGEVKKLILSPRKANDLFGNALSMSGNYFIAGVRNEDTNEQTPLINAGSAYIYWKDQGGTDQWGLHKKLTAATRSESGLFGYSVSLHGDYALVSAPGYNGPVSIFRKDQDGAGSWGLIRQLVPPVPNENFGLSVAITSDFAIVGASRGTGAAYVFKRDLGGADNWGSAQKLTASVSREDDLFGNALAISGNSIIVGVPNDDYDESEANPVVDAGSIYIFQNGNPLPVTLATFDAKKNENTVLLQWTTSAETNTDHFEILRSADAQSWETLGHVQAAKESTELLTYTFTDNKPSAGKNFYRLKMVDEDGSFAYSRIRNVSFDITGSIALYPNPVSEKLFFNDTDLDKITSASIINILGQTIMQVSKITKEGIAIHQLAAGMYLVQVRKKNGSVQTHKVIIAR